MMSFKFGNAILLVSLVMALLSFVKAVKTDMTGQWSIQAQFDGRLRLQLQYGEKRKSRASVSTHIALTQFQGLTQEQVFASTSRINFSLAREAGTIMFSGSFHDGKGTGEWTLKADPAFLSLLRQHGYEQPTNGELYALAASDVRGSYITDLEDAGYPKLPVSQLIALYTNEVTAAYIKSLQDAGYKGLTAAQLIALRTNGVTRDFIERLEKRVQKNLTPEGLLSLRTNAGTPD
jgi:hypothetical protein